MPTSILTLARMLSLEGSYGLSLLGISSTAGTGCEGDAVVVIMPAVTQ